MASKGRQAHAKGGSFERKIAKELTSWWGGGEFHRTPGSGQLHWAEDNRVSGDIVPPNGSDFFFSVECKDHNSTKIEQLVNTYGSGGEFSSFWKQCTGDAMTYDKIPMLVFKCLRVKPWVVLPFHTELFQKALAFQEPVFSSVIIYKNIRDEDQVYHVISTPLETLTKMTKHDIKTIYEKFNWQERTKLL